MNAPIIVSALFGPADAALLNGLRRAHLPPARNQLAAHLTLFHHLPPSVVDDLVSRLKATTRGQPPPPARLAGLMDLGGGTAIRIASDALVAIRADLAAAFADCLIPQDRGTWRPHVTIQNKVPAAVARALQAELAGRLDDRPLAIVGLAAWWYRGGPWERIAAWRFAGLARR